MERIATQQKAKGRILTQSGLYQKFPGAYWITRLVTGIGEFPLT